MEGPEERGRLHPRAVDGVEGAQLEDHGAVGVVENPKHALAAGVPVRHNLSQTVPEVGGPQVSEILLVVWVVVIITVVVVSVVEALRINCSLRKVRLMLRGRWVRASRLVVPPCCYSTVKARTAAISKAAAARRVFPFVHPKPAKQIDVLQGLRPFLQLQEADGGVVARLRGLCATLAGGSRAHRAQDGLVLMGQALQQGAHHFVVGIVVVGVTQLFDTLGIPAVDDGELPRGRRAVSKCEGFFVGIGRRLCKQRLGGLLLQEVVEAGPGAPQLAKAVRPPLHVNLCRITVDVGHLQAFVEGKLGGRLPVHCTVVLDGEGSAAAAASGPLGGGIKHIYLCPPGVQCWPQ
mmetsp:Transcript_31249/g.88606  ORF Transcript_31249/g.88606 Transcript_31249/m.88606 type:complete len:349 (-) Transcript_31249:1135-2181(-)